MTAKAPISTGWRIRLGGMAIMFVGFCAYFLYDGFVGYESQREIYLAYQVFKNDHKDLTDGKLRELWEEKEVPKGRPPIGPRDAEPFHGFNHSDGSITTQRVIGFAMIPVAALMVFSWIKTFSRWVAADDAGVTASTGQAAAWGSMVRLDKTRWPKKGIAFLVYTDPNMGIDQRILLDDFKFDPVATGKIIRAIEDHLTDDQIIGDIRESERDKRKAEKAAATHPGAVGASSNPQTPNTPG
jgi:hypothetical protein